MLKNAGEYDLNEVGQIDFSYRAICCHIIIEKPDNKTDLAIYIEQRNPDRKVLFSLDEASGRLTIAGELTDSIIEQAMHGGSP